MDLASPSLVPGGLTPAKHLDIPFVQEVVVVATQFKRLRAPDRCCIELAEDAKIIYFTGGVGSAYGIGICAEVLVLY